MPPIDSDTHKWVDPMKFTYADGPIIVLCEDRRGAMGFVIKEHTANNYNHAMDFIHEGKFASQNTLFREIPCTDYMHDYNFLKFWRIKNLSIADRGAIYNKINADLALPWPKRLYDYGGLLGQALWMPWIQIPGLYYCSERTAMYARLVSRIAPWVPTRPSPGQLDNLFKAHPDDMELIGYWWAD